MKGKLLAVAVFLSTSLSASAAVVLQIDGSGQLTGALGVPVNSVEYDVTFVDGTCIDLFDGCDNAAEDFDFESGHLAVLAGQSVLDNVFVGTFDSDPGSTFGCEAGVTSCRVVIPRDGIMSSTLVGAVFATNTIGFEWPADGSGSLRPDSDLSLSPRSVYARFTPSAIPVPAAAYLFMTGLAGLVGWGRYSKDRPDR